MSAPGGRTAADTGELARRLRVGERRALAQAITLVESARADHQERAQALLEQLGGSGDSSLRLAVSGVPGVGKSTFIEALGLHCIGLGRKVAVLTVDPSSVISGGSILGDKTRMQRLGAAPEAFVRPSAAGAELGGVHRRTRESIVLCEAAGYDLVVVETVGVGQSESAVVGMTDMFLLLLLPGGGDELQGIKRGIVELADLVLVNKADGELAATAGRTVADYRNALRLLRPRLADWQVAVERCSSLNGEGIEAAWDKVARFEESARTSGQLMRRRAEQAGAWMDAELRSKLEDSLRDMPGMQGVLDWYRTQAKAGELPPGIAARKVMERFIGAVRGLGRGATNDEDD